MSRKARRPLNWNAIQINSRKPELVEGKLRAGDFARDHGATVYALVPAAPMTTLLNFVNCFVIDTLPNWSELVPLSLAERRHSIASSSRRHRSSLPKVSTISFHRANP
jgi:hypothetical protein